MYDSKVIFDHRSQFKGSTGKFKTKKIDSVETIGDESDYIIRLLNNETHIFRCSCCITFMGDNLIIT